MVVLEQFLECNGVVRRPYTTSQGENPVEECQLILCRYRAKCNHLINSLYLVLHSLCLVLQKHIRYDSKHWFTLCLPICLGVV